MLDDRNKRIVSRFSQLFQFGCARILNDRFLCSHRKRYRKKEREQAGRLYVCTYVPVCVLERVPVVGRCASSSVSLSRSHLTYRLLGTWPDNNDDQRVLLKYYYHCRRYTEPNDPTDSSQRRRLSSCRSFVRSFVR